MVGRTQSCRGREAPDCGSDGAIIIISVCKITEENSFSVQN